MRLRQILIVFIVLSSVSAVMSLYFFHLQKNLIHRVSLENARIIADSLSTFRSLYTSEVVETVAEYNVPVTHLYEKGKSIPLPATLSILLGEKFTGLGDGARTSLFSPYPFPGKGADGGLQDEFARHAWAALSRRDKDHYYEFETRNGVETLRYAKADYMQEACLDCHNNHPDTPKNDWQDGDLRGILEVTIPLEHASYLIHKDLGITVFIFIILTLLGVYGFFRILSVHLSYNQTLQNEVELRTRELENKKAEAEKANTEKSLFLARMSHELRTPMNAILGFSQLLETEATDQSQKEKCQQILNSGTHLLDLINELLDIELIESGETENHIEEIQVDTLLNEIIQICSPLTLKNNINIHEYQDCGLTLLGDRKHFKQVMINLISNAIKYNKDNGQIQIKSSSTPHAGVKIEVSDTGHGLTEEQKGKLFQSMERLDADKNGVDGIGIGLVISKKLVEAMDGKIGIESTPGQGTTFWIELPTAD